MVTFNNESGKMGLIGKTNENTKNKLGRDHGSRRKRQHPLPGAFNRKNGKLITVCNKSQITYKCLIQKLIGYTFSHLE